MHFDLITLQILWDRLVGVADEAATTLLRTSFSPVVQECNDYLCSIMDNKGQALADSSGSIPAFIGTLPKTTREILKVMPPEMWEPGDIVITNDPWIGTGHLLDFCLVAPVFHRGRLAAFVGSVAHAVDVGGISWGSHARDVYEEGIRIPISKLLQRGKPNSQLLEILQANVRVPEVVTGDLFAQVASIDVCIRRVGEFLTDAELDDLSDLAVAIQRHSENAMRAAIRQLPDGAYEHALSIDGFDKTLTIRACLTVAGDCLEMNYEGTSPQVDRGINSVLHYTYAYTAYPLKCALDPTTAKNEGSYRPIVVRAPLGSILNPRFPAPVSGRHLTGMYCAAAVFGAMAKAAPEQVMADSSGPPSRAILSGIDRDGKSFSLSIFAWGGMGALADMDGLPCTAYPGNANCASIEGMEVAAPVRFHCKKLIPNSGGIGRFQGGSGQQIALEFVSSEPGQLSMMSTRYRSPPQGLLGGGPGSLSGCLVNGEQIPPNGRIDLKPGDVLEVRYPGGGGYGEPAERDPERVARDVLNGILSADHARAAYGTAWERRARSLGIGAEGAPSGAGGRR